jgi:hypothetical protein
MDYRQKFEEIKDEKLKGGVEEPKELADLVNRITSSQRKYRSYESGGLVSLSVCGRHESDGVFAFILDEHYGEPRAGIRYSTDFGIVKDGKVHRHGFMMTRGGRVNDTDNPSVSYNTVRILESGEKTVLGLESRDALDIYEVGDEGSFSMVTRYDLKAERDKQKKKELAEKAAKTESFEEKVKLLGRKLEKDKGKESYDGPGSKILEVNGKKLALIWLNYYDRDYDASIKDVEFYAVDEDSAEPKLVATRHLKYDQSYKSRERFFCVDAQKRISKPVEEDGKIRIPVEMKIRGVFDTGNPLSPTYNNVRFFGDDMFDIVYSPEASSFSEEPSERFQQLTEIRADPEIKHHLDGIRKYTRQDYVAGVVEEALIAVENKRRVAFYLEMASKCIGTYVCNLADVIKAHGKDSETVWQICNEIDSNDNDSKGTREVIEKYKQKKGE